MHGGPPPRPVVASRNDVFRSRIPEQQVARMECRVIRDDGGTDHPAFRCTSSGLLAASPLSFPRSVVAADPASSEAVSTVSSGAVWAGGFPQEASVSTAIGAIRSARRSSEFRMRILLVQR
jgi:ribonuclease PH